MVGIASAVVVLLGVAAAIVLLSSRDNARRAAEPSSLVTPGASGSPYDFTESPDSVDLKVIAESSFVSLLMVDDQGKVTSYGVSAQTPAVKELISAVLASESVDPGAAGASIATGDWVGPTLTFVLPGRQTLTFALDLDTGTLARGERTWRPRGDLRALVEAAVTKP